MHIQKRYIVENNHDIILKAERRVSMILAEKIIKLRKQKGWSQEDLALQMGVSRQSVSKWESMSSLPDLDKIIKLSNLFGVSTDYLLKDDIEEEPGYEPDTLNSTTSSSNISTNSSEDSCIEVSLEEANKYMTLVEKSANKMAGAVAACILSPVFLILFSGYAETGIIGINEDVAACIGAAVLLIMIAGAVFIFVSVGIQLSKYEYLEKECLNLQYGIAGIVEAKKEAYEAKYKTSIAIGVALCILSVVPILIAAGFNFQDQVYISLTALLLIFIACGVFLFVSVGMVHSCYEKLLEEGEFTRERKMNVKKNSNLTTIYWGIVTAAYLGYSFITMDWGRSWIIWPVAGVLYAVVIGIANSMRKK